MSEFDLNIEQLREEYLATIDEDLSNVEHIIVSLEHSKKVIDDVRQVFRVVHSIKGGAGSYNLLVLSSICHRFEDYIASFDDKSEINSFIDQSLKYIDLLKNCSHDYEAGKKDLDKYISYLDGMGPSREGDEVSSGRVLIVDTTKSIPKIFKRSLKSLNLEISQTDDGLEAFRRLVSERFDALVTSVNVNTLDGLSVISALKTTNNINKKIPTIALSANDNINLDDLPFRPDHFVVKDGDLASNAKRIMDSIFDQQSEEVSGIKNILYVEDDPRIQKIVNLSLQKYGQYDLSLASDEQEAFSQIEKTIPDLILMDNYLKETTGIDVYKKLAKDDRYKNIPVIFLTATVADIKLDELRKIGLAVGVIAKPINIKSLSSEIKVIMNSR